MHQARTHTASCARKLHAQIYTAWTHLARAHLARTHANTCTARRHTRCTHMHSLYSYARTHAACILVSDASRAAQRRRQNRTHGSREAISCRARMGLQRDHGGATSTLTPEERAAALPLAT